MRRAAQFIVFSLILASNLACADFHLNLVPGVSPVSQDIYNLHMTILWVCVAISVVVFGALFYSVIHYRKSKARKISQIHESLKIELTWTIIPFLILVLIAIPSTKVLMHMRDTDHEDITIKITGFQWKWKYDYLDHGITFFSNITTPFNQIHNQAPKTADYLRTVDHPLVVPIHKKIRFLVTSNDVIHAWSVPAIGVKQDAIPGFINETWTRIDRAGTYFGQCTELCGLNHAYMPIVVIAKAEEDFKNWVALQKGLALPPTTSSISQKTIPLATPAAAIAKKLTLPELMQIGEKVYLTICSVCHQPTGLGMPPTFPALKDSPIATGPLPAHIDRVMNGKQGTAMQAFKEQLSDEELAGVITYERNSFGNKAAGIVQPDDIKALRGKK